MTGTGAVGQAGLGLGKGLKKIRVGITFGDMNGKDVTTKDEVHGEGVVGMNNQSEIMKYRPN